MTSIDESDPTISAVVELHPPGDLPDALGAPDEYQRQTAMLKAHLTAAGFEVHAPFASSFSIGAKISQFVDYFGDPVKMEDDGVFTSITVEGGGRELNLEPVPEEGRQMVKAIHFMPPPDFFPRG